MGDEKLFAGIYVDADLIPGIAIALRQRNYASQSALEDGFSEPRTSRFWNVQRS